MDDRWVDRMRRRIARRGQSEPAEDVRVEAEALAPDEDKPWCPTVPYVPVRCPGCGHSAKVTDGVHNLKEGRTRYHICKGCRMQFRSLEIER